MSGREAEGTQGPSPSEVERIAEACERFEAAWGRGERPRIEESLGDLGPDVDPMLSRLLPLELSLRLAAGDSPSPGEYLSRFPGSRGLVEAAFADHTTVADATAAAPPRPPDGRGSAVNLLTGILALQNGFIDHVALIAAIRAWAADRSRGVAQILAAEGKLDARQVTLLEALAEEHRNLHGDDLQKSLAAFGSLTSVMRAVAGMGDPEIEAGLTIDPESTIADGEATTAHNDAPGDAAGPGPGHTWSASRFEVLSFHNAGMLGKVFIALDRELNRNVALKEIQEKHAHHRVNRDQFVLEGMVTGALEHPGIVPVYSLGIREDGSPFYAMRFIQGPSLREKLKQLHGTADAPALAPGEERPTLPRLLRPFIHACHAMAYAHSRGVIHRDLKPEHILLGPFGETLVVDWGLAMPVAGGADEPYATLEFPTGRDAALAQDGVVVGTLPYMSPEQAEGMQSKLDRRSDVYALGAILYALLTGRAPVAGGNFATMLVRVRRGDFPRPRDVARQAPPALEAICIKAMSHAPDGRYASATELARDVERWLDDEPTVAYPEPLAVRAGRWLRRHRTAAVAAAVALICTSAGLAALAIQTGRANVEIRKQRDRAEDSRAEAVAARTEVEASFRDSLGLVDRLLLRVTGEDLPEVPGATKLRQDVADEASRFLDALRERRPADPDALYAAGRASREVATILRMLGRPDGEALDRAVELFRAAIAAAPRLPHLRDALAHTLQDIAGSQQLADRPDLAAEPLREAVELAAGLRRDFPDVPDHRRTAARIACSLAEVATSVGDFETAAVHAREACELLPPLADSPDPGPEDRLLMLGYRCVEGEALRELGRWAESEAALDDAIRRADALLAASPTDVNARYLRLAALITRGETLAGAGGRDDAARADFDAAVAGFESLAAEAGEVVHFREFLSIALLARAQGPARPDPPRADLDRAAAILDELLKPDAAHPAYCGLMGRVQGSIARLELRQAADPAAREAARRRLARAADLQRVALKANPRSPEDQRALREHEAALRSIDAPAASP